MANEDLKVKIADLSNEIETLRKGLSDSEKEREKIIKQMESYNKDLRIILSYLIESGDSEKIKVNTLIADFGRKVKYQLNYIPIGGLIVDEGWN